MNQTPPEVNVILMIWVLGFLAVLAYGVGRFGVWLQSVQLSSVFVKQTTEDGADGQTDEADERVSAPFDVAERLQLDRTRGGMIDSLVASGWAVSQIRTVVKGDNNTISAEVAEAQNRLYVAAESRTIHVREHQNGRRIERKIPL